MDDNMTAGDEPVQDRNHNLTPPQRALADAAAWRKGRCDATGKPLREIDGRGGLDPVRYGDWEVKGLTSDF